MGTLVEKILNNRGDLSMAKKRKKTKPGKQTPMATIHKYCRYCIQSRQDSEVENCMGHLVHATGKPCPFYAYRTGLRRAPLKAFRQFCLECMGGSPSLVSECRSERCPIHPYRLGSNPHRAGIGGTDKKESGRPLDLVRNATLSGGF